MRFRPDNPSEILDHEHVTIPYPSQTPPNYTLPSPSDIMPPKPVKPMPERRQAGSRRPSEAGSDKSAMFNLANPNWLTDSRSDPAKHEEHSERAKKAAAKRRQNMFQPAEPPGTFPSEVGTQMMAP